MAKRKNYVVTDKQTSIKNYIRNLLWLKNIIDDHGNILNVELYRSEIELVRHNREVESINNTTVDGVVIDRELAAIFVGEIQYLDEIIKHTKNINPLLENPVTSHEDLCVNVRNVGSQIRNFFARKRHK